jgi:hypothetical protein
MALARMRTRAVAAMHGTKVLASRDLGTGRGAAAVAHWLASMWLRLPPLLSGWTSCGVRRRGRARMQCRSEPTCTIDITTLFTWDLAEMAPHVLRPGWHAHIKFPSAAAGLAMAALLTCEQ